MSKIYAILFQKKTGDTTITNNLAIVRQEQDNTDEAIRVAREKITTGDSQSWSCVSCVWLDEEEREYSKNDWMLYIIKQRDKKLYDLKKRMFTKAERLYLTNKLNVK